MRYIAATVVVLVAYIAGFSYLICPHVTSKGTVVPVTSSYELNLTPIQPVLTVLCKYINEINQENIGSFTDNVVFHYQIYVKNRWNYFAQYYYPKYKLVASTKWGNFKNILELHVFSRVKLYFELLKLQLVKVKLSIVESSYFETYLNSKFHFICKKLTENSNFQKFNEKKNFLKNEINNLINLKLGTEKVDVDLKYILEDSSGYYDYGSDDDTPITIKITSTIYESMDQSIETRSPVQANIDDLLNLFEQKVNKTVDLAFINISNEINPIINKTTDRLRDELQDKMKYIQQQNYEYYKKTHLLIKEIDKDYSHIKEHNEVRESVSRQAMRDQLDEIRSFDASRIEEIEKIINDEFELLVNSYLSIIQNTIDILESFADHSFQDISNKLSDKLSDSDDEEFNWSAWKRFHHLKNLVLDKRDYIFDEANLLKQKKFTDISLESDFQKWLSFLQSIDFHVTFISRDTDEYLQILRAKANVSYQLREQAVRELNVVPEDVQRQLGKTKPQLESQLESQLEEEQLDEEAEEEAEDIKREAERIQHEAEDIIREAEKAQAHHRAQDAAIDGEVDTEVDLSDDPEVDKD